jgi:pyridoxamine 5'-phosphate oxidase
MVHDNEPVLKIVTDSRSEKVSHLANTPFFELVWWFPASSEQYRIAGSIHVVSSSESDSKLREARIEQWSALSDPGREQFFWDQPNIAYTGVPAGPTHA